MLAVQIIDLVRYVHARCGSSRYCHRHEALLVEKSVMIYDEKTFSSITRDFSDVHYG